MQDRNIQCVAIVGCGAVFEAFYLQAMRGLVASGRCAVTLMVDPNETQARSFGDGFPGVSFSRDLSTGLNATKVDRALVLTPPSTHAGLLRQLAAAGIHVYCEKPLTVEPGEAEEMAYLFRERALLCHVGFVRRMFPNFRLMKSAIEQLPSPLELRLSDGEVFRWPIRTDGIFRPSEAGGGVVWDKLSHNLDLVQWLDGIESVDRVTSRCRADQVPVDVLVAGRTRRGTFEIAVSWADILPNVVTIRSGTHTLRSRNGLVPSITFSGEPPAADRVVFDVTSYAQAVEASLEKFLDAYPTDASVGLATAEESVVLTRLLAVIDERARRGAA